MKCCSVFLLSGGFYRLNILLHACCGDYGYCCFSSYFWTWYNSWIPEVLLLSFLFHISIWSLVQFLSFEINGLYSVSSLLLLFVLNKSNLFFSIISWKILMYDKSQSSAALTEQNELPTAFLMQHLLPWGAFQDAWSQENNGKNIKLDFLLTILKSIIINFCC